jgi:hypothetical protein
MRILCFFGLHIRGGWRTDYSLTYTPVLGAFFPNSPIANKPSYRAFNRCKHCGNVKCKFVSQ